MKKLIVAMLAVVLGLASCTKDSSSLVGTWELEKVVATAFGEKVEMTPEEADMEWTITFKANGECETTLNGTTATGEYEVSDGKLIIDGVAFDYSRSGRTFTLKMTEAGVNMDLIFKKK